MNETQATKELGDLDVKHLFHPYTNPRKHEQTGPIVIERGEGVFVYDTNGQQYLEGLAGLWSVAVGFGEKRLVEAATKQMQMLPFYHLFAHKSHTPGIKLAEKLSEMAPGTLNHVLFSNSGSEANDSVIKLVWFYNNALGRPKKKRFLARKNGYHGINVASGSLTGIPSNHNAFDLPQIPVTHLECPHYYRFGKDGETEQQFTDRLIKELEDTIEAEGADTIAAFIGEPVMGAGGVIVPPVGYWPRVQAVCRKHNILLVLDEVITGFGRLGTTFAAELFGVEPDMLVVSKQITSSYQPLAAVIFSEQIYQAVADKAGALGTFAHGLTAGGHPVATAVALENLAIIEERGLVANAKEVGAYMRGKLAGFASHPMVGEVRGEGLMAAVEMVADKATKRKFDPVGKVGGYLAERGHAHGLIVRNLGDSIAFCPPMIITKAEVDMMISKFSKALDETYDWAKSEGLVS
ncbi:MULTISPECIES: aspartate aminotransferase family protein [Rhodopseudomonas]|uniref:Aminotransferase n=1 Tax=Rhodopseudomonas palustris TaxID=1076 RepID=A0A0D7E0S0_RHOPL|nr:MULTISPECIES: aspartate aminotransferase family protein [Rhodopseudomonas]KIZ34116.1 aminotransferase [Rhodopseudomonas palustris]MDF3812716.1 aspartate aminotransferase family protein [Rhodopseudomonas sp. BAL398]WOK15779.1 aspartate aminotransferase family protein [Rhodopseudomonas sp. BAL398]